MIKAVIFDLDGTIGDTLPLCVAAFRKAVEQLANQVLTDDEIMATFGPSEEGTIMKLIPDHYREGVESYLHHYRELHDRCPSPFEGMKEAIEALKASGVIVAMVTGKGGRSCEVTLDRYRMGHLFDKIETGSPEGQRKKEGIQAVLDAYQLKPTEAIYVGDAPSDIEACHQVGVPIVAAAWAETANPEVLMALNPRWIFYTVSEFVAFLEEGVK